MDDGYLRCSGCGLCTEAFSLGCVTILKDVLNYKYNIKATFYSRNSNDNKKIFTGYRLFIGVAACETFIPLIKPLVLPFMFYKFPKKYQS
jgi:hypothetical protein